MAIPRSIYEEILSSVLKLRFPKITTLSDEQDRALFSIINRKDVFAILPTGHGKSIIFQLLPDISRELALKGFCYPQNGIVIVICPLKSLVNSHIRELEAHGITATSLTGEEVDESGLLRGSYSFVFASPESLLQNDKWRNMLQSDVYQKRVVSIVTDEAHVVPKWGYGKHQGTSSNKEFVAAFRECFSRLGELRSLGPQNPLAPVLALTATANLKTQVLIKKSLCLRKDCVEIFISPNRANIYLNKKKVSSDIAKSFKWLVDKIRMENISMNKTIVYCKSIKDCGRLFMYFKAELGKDSYYSDNESESSKQLLFGMFHHCTLQKQQNRVLDSFFDNKGICRLVFATNALGMGVNFPTVRLVVHYGPPREMEELVQQIGRAGRDGQHADAMMMFHGHHLRNCDNSIKEYCKSSSGCLRKLLLNEFGTQEVKNCEGHDCCVHCHKECLCQGEDGCNVPLPNFILDSDNNPKPNDVQARTVSKDQKVLLRELLQEYKQDLSAGILSYLSAESTTAFSDILIKLVLRHAKNIFTKTYIMDNLPVFKNSHATDIICMIQDVFEDIPATELNQNESTTITKFVTHDLEYGGMYEEVINEFCDGELESSSEDEG